MSLEQLERQAEAARIELEASRRMLYEDGRPVFGPDQQGRKEDETLRTFVTKLANVLARAEQEADSAQRIVEQEDENPRVKMSADELMDARGMLESFREKTRPLSMREVVDQMRRALATNDRVKMYLWTQLAPERLVGVAPTNGTLPPVEEMAMLPAVEIALEDINAALIEKSARAQVVAAHTTLQRVERLRQRVRRMQQVADGTEERIRTESRKYTYTHF